MKTHELANALTQMARALKEAPNMEIGDIRILHSEKLLANDGSNIAVNLQTLIDLSNIDRQQWVAFIEENGFEIQIRQRDGSRDILGKLLKHLEKNAEARKKLKDSISSKASKASPELMKAFSTLLKE